MLHFFSSKMSAKVALLAHLAVSQELTSGPEEIKPERWFITVPQRQALAAFSRQYTGDPRFMKGPALAYLQKRFPDLSVDLDQVAYQLERSREKPIVQWTRPMLEKLQGLFNEYPHGYPKRYRVVAQAMGIEGVSRFTLHNIWVRYTHEGRIDLDKLEGRTTDLAARRELGAKAPSKPRQPHAHLKKVNQ